MIPFVIVEFDTNYVDLDDFYIYSSDEVIHMTWEEDCGKKDKNVLELVYYEDYLILCCN